MSLGSSRSGRIGCCANFKWQCKICLHEPKMLPKTHCSLKQQCKISSWGQIAPMRNLLYREQCKTSSYEHEIQPRTFPHFTFQKDVNSNSSHISVCLYPSVFFPEFPLRPHRIPETALKKHHKPNMQLYEALIKLILLVTKLSNLMQSMKSKSIRVFDVEWKS